MSGKSVFICRNSSLISLRSYCTGSSKKLLEFLAKMPKAKNASVMDTQRVYGNIKKSSRKYPPSNVYLQVIGSGARGAPNSLYLFTDHSR